MYGGTPEENKELVLEDMLESESTEAGRVKLNKLSERLYKALQDPLWKDHRPNDLYDLQRAGGGEWELIYYPLFENPKTGEVYNEPRGLWLKIVSSEYWDLREAPLRYATKLSIRKS